MIKYSFYYPISNVIQEKVLVPHSEFVKANIISDSKRKQALKMLGGGQEWFTDQSPLFDAIKTGILNCNGVYKCIVTKI